MSKYALAAANVIIDEQVNALAQAHEALIALVAAADSHVELAKQCDQGRKAIARIEGRKPCAERKQRERVAS